MAAKYQNQQDPRPPVPLRWTFSPHCWGKWFHLPARVATEAKCSSNDRSRLRIVGSGARAEHATHCIVLDWGSYCVRVPVSLPRHHNYSVTRSRSIGHHTVEVGGEFTEGSNQSPGGRWWNSAEAMLDQRERVGGR